MKIIAYHGSVKTFHRIVLPALRRAGMLGLRIVEHPARIQAMVETALQRDPEYVRSLAEAR